MAKVNRRKFPSPLRQGFEGFEEMRFSYSQAWQDIFVLVVLDGLIGGKYLEIGAGDARNINNTYLLEQEFSWTGISLDIDPKAVRSYEIHRKNSCILADACEIDVCDLLKKTGFGTHVDYLQVDIEPSTNSLTALKNVMKSGIRPRVVTFETDFYDPNTDIEISHRVRQDSRGLMENYGYELITGDMGSTSAADPFEDWYVDPLQVEVARLSKFRDLPKKAMASEVALFKGPFIIATEFYDGQGLGNQLWTYVVTRLAALRQEFDFAIGGINHFKGRSFIDLEFGIPLRGGLTNEGGPPLKLPMGFKHYYSEQKLVDKTFGIDISTEDTKIWALPPGTKIDGNFQSYEYLRGHEELVRSWIKVKSNTLGDLSTDENVCLIHVRGGDFKNLKNTALGPDYYNNSITYLRSTFGVNRFVAITDDASYAESILPKDVKIFEGLYLSRNNHQARHHIGNDVEGDFLALMQAEYLIISNSSFCWWAAFLNTRRQVVVAPKFWAAYNSPLKIWSTGEIITPGFTYIDTRGDIFSAEECTSECKLGIRAEIRRLSGGSSNLASLCQHVRGRLEFRVYLIRFWIVKLVNRKFSSLTWHSIIKKFNLE